MSFGALPPHLQQEPAPAPPGGMTMGGHMARLFQQAQQRGAQRRAYGANRDAFVAAAAQRLASIGSREAAQLAELLQANPEGANEFVQQYGGWKLMEDGLRAAAATGAAQRFVGTLPEGSPERAYSEYALQANPSAPDLVNPMRQGFEREERQAGRDFGARESARERGWRSNERREGQDFTRSEREAEQTYRSREAAAERDWRSQEGAKDRESRERIGAARAASRYGPTPSQQASNRKIARNRGTIRELVAEHDWSERDLRRIAARADSMGIAAMMAALEAGPTGSTDGDEDYAAALWKAASEPMVGVEDEDFDLFRDLAEGDLHGAQGRRQDDDDEAAAADYLQRRFGPR